MQCQKTLSNKNQELSFAIKKLNLANTDEDIKKCIRKLYDAISAFPDQQKQKAIECVIENLSASSLEMMFEKNTAEEALKDYQPSAFNEFSKWFDPIFNKISTVASWMNKWYLSVDDDDAPSMRDILSTKSQRFIIGEPPGHSPSKNSEDLLFGDLFFIIELLNKDPTYYEESKGSQENQELVEVEKEKIKRLLDISNKILSDLSPKGYEEYSTKKRLYFQVNNRYIANRIIEYQKDYKVFFSFAVKITNIFNINGINTELAIKEKFYKKNLWAKIFGFLGIRSILSRFYLNKEGFELREYINSFVALNKPALYYVLEKKAEETEENTVSNFALKFIGKELGLPHTDKVSQQKPNTSNSQLTSNKPVNSNSFPAILIRKDNNEEPRQISYSYIDKDLSYEELAREIFKKIDWTKIRKVKVLNNNDEEVLFTIQVKEEKVITASESVTPEVNSKAKEESAEVSRSDTLEVKDESMVASISGDPKVKLKFFGSCCKGEKSSSPVSNVPEICTLSETSIH